MARRSISISSRAQYNEVSMPKKPGKTMADESLQRPRLFCERQLPQEELDKELAEQFMCGDRHFYRTL